MTNNKKQVIEKYEKNGKTLYRFKLSIYQNGYNTSISGSNYATKKLAREGMERKKANKIKEIEQWPTKLKSRANANQLQPKTLEDVFNEYNSLSGHKLSTLETRKSIFYTKIWNPYFRVLNKSAFQLTKQDILGFRNFLLNDYKTVKGENLERSGINKAFSYLRLILEHASASDELSEKNLKEFSRLLVPLPESKKRTKVLGEEDLWSKNEYDRFYNHLGNYKTTIIYRQFFQILFLGLRKGEARALKVKDIYYSETHGHPVISITKSMNDKKNIVGDVKSKNSERTIKIPEKVYESVKEYVNKRELEPDDYLFLNTKKTSVITSGNIRDKYVSICKRAGLKPMTVHQHRHRVAFLLYTSDPNRNVANIAYYLGHTVDVFHRNYLLESTQGSLNIANVLAEDIN